MHREFLPANSPLVVAFVVASGLSAFSLPASADDAASAPSHAERHEKMQEAREAFKERFDAADANHDGQLTKDEAKSKMPKIYEHFDEIDTARKGSVTKQDIAKWMKSQRQAHHGAASQRGTQ